MLHNRRNRLRTRTGSSGLVVATLLTISMCLVCTAVKSVSDGASSAAQPAVKGQTGWFKSDSDTQIVNDAPVVKNFLGEPDMVPGIDSGVRATSPAIVLPGQGVIIGGVAVDCRVAAKDPMFPKSGFGRELNANSVWRGPALPNGALSSRLTNKMLKPDSVLIIANIPALPKVGPIGNGHSTKTHGSLLGTNGGSSLTVPAQKSTKLNTSGYGSDTQVRGLLLKGI